jgi:hypothetical protein
MTEVRRQMTEVRRQMSENGGQKTDGRKRRSEDRWQIMEAIKPSGACILNVKISDLTKS